MDQIFGTAASCGNWTPDNSWHTFRFEANGNSLRLLVDGTQSFQTIDYRLLNSGISGIFDTGVQMNVRAIRVIAL